MKKSKMILSLLLVLLFFIQSLSSTLAANVIDYKADSVNTEVKFSKGYAETGVPLKAIVSGYSKANVLYEWYVGDQLVPQSGSSYTPQEKDLERYIKVKVYTTEGEYLCETKMYFSKLPVVYIDTVNNEPIVSKKIVLKADMKVQGNAQYNDSSILYNGVTEIKGRGNSSWNMPKKPYKLKLDKKTDMFGMGSNKHWVLIANYSDPSLMRDNVAYQLSGRMGMPYQDGVFVNLILNGKFDGCYQFVEHVRVGETRTDIFDWEACAEDAGKAIAKKVKMSNADRDEMIVQMTENMLWITSDTVTFKGVTYKVSDSFQVPDINGGYLLNLDSYYDSVSRFKTSNGLLMNIEKPEYLKSNPTMMNSIKGYVQAFENGLYASDFKTVYKGETVRYTDLIDLDSFVKGWLVNELFQNKDFGYKSTYMYKPIDGKLTYGPVWDMDWSSDSMATSTSFKRFVGNRAGVFQWLTTLLQDPVFLERAHELYWEYRNTLFQDLIKDGGVIDTNSEYLKEAGNKNDYLWQRRMASTQDAMHLKTWIKLRLDCFDKYFETSESLFKSIHPQLPVPSDLLVENDTDLTRVTGLSIESMPNKTDYLTGEKFDLEGLKLRATFGNASTALVEPDNIVIKDVAPGEPKLIMSVKASDIPAFNNESSIEKIVTLYYENKTVTFSINIKKEFTVQAVQSLISILPATINLSHKQLVLNAKKAYDSLSAAEKINVTNAQILTNAINRIKGLVSSNPTHVYNAYTSGNYRFYYYTYLVVETNDSPDNMAFYDKTNNFFVNCPRSSMSTISILPSEFGGEIWTVYFYNDTHLYGIESGNPLVTDTKYNINTSSSIVKNTYKWPPNTYVRDSSDYMHVHSYEFAGNNAEIVTSPDVGAIELKYTDGYTQTFISGYSELMGHRVWNVEADGEFTVNAVQSVYADGISFGSSFSQMFIGQSLMLSPIYMPSNATIKGVTWISSNSNVASVDTHGKVTAISKGTAKITASYKFGGYEAVYEIRVENPAEPVSNIVLSDTRIQMNYKSEILLTAIVLPDDAVYDRITWESSNTNVCTVDSDGNVTAVGIGTAEITASAGGVASSCNVTVKYNLWQWLIIIFLFGFLWY